MVKYNLKASAELANVTNLQPVDTPESPFEYTFIIECTKCRQVHDKPVSINRYESHEISGSKGEASFVYKCRECKLEHSATITRTKDTVDVEDNNKFKSLLTIDARGIDFNEFIPEGRFQCVGSNSTSKFDEVDLIDGEWYDYDDNSNEEVSITDIKWEINRI